MKSTGLPVIKAINKQQNYSLHQLSKWSQQIDMQRMKTVHDQEEIKKQKKIARQNSTLLNNSILQIQQQAITISRQIQQQQTKFQHLSILVKNAQKQILAEKQQRKQKKQKELIKKKKETDVDEQKPKDVIKKQQKPKGVIKKQQQLQDVIEKKGTDEYEQQIKILKEKQKILQKLFERLNASEFEISKKIDTIRSLKKDRGFHSNLFDTLESEYFDVVFYYKQQLIQRTLRERILEKATAEFNKVLQKSQEESPQFDAYGGNHGNGLIDFDNRQGRKGKQQPRVSQISEIRLARPSQAKRTDTLKTKKPLEKSERTTQDLRKFEFKKKVNQILHDFGCKSYQQFTSADINSQSPSHEQVLAQANNYFEQICNLQNSIKQLQAQICQRRNNSQVDKSKKKKYAESTIYKYQAEITRQKEEVGRFKVEFYEVIGRLLKKDEKEGEARRVVESVQSSKEGGLNFTQDMQVLKQAMTFINDTILKGPFPQFPLSKKSSNKTSTQNPRQRIKAKKMTLIHVSNEPIEGPSTSNKRSQGLNEILRTYQNDNQRLKKQDTLSILTQQEFIQESKNIIMDVNKKSIFARGNQPVNNKK